MRLIARLYLVIDQPKEGNLTYANLQTILKEWEDKYMPVLRAEDQDTDVHAK